MAGITKRERLNRELQNYRHFDTEAEALSFVKAHKLRSYVMSCNMEETCWTIYHKNLWKM